MITKISDKKIMNIPDARRKYEDYFIGFMVTKDHEHQDKILGYPIYKADESNEAYREIGKYEIDESSVIVISGTYAEEVSLGGMYLD